MGPPRVPTYYNFAWVPHTFGGLTPPDPPYFAHWALRASYQVLPQGKTIAILLFKTFRRLYVHGKWKCMTMRLTYGLGLQRLGQIYSMNDAQIYRVDQKNRTFCWWAVTFLIIRIKQVKRFRKYQVLYSSQKWKKEWRHKWRHVVSCVNNVSMTWAGCILNNYWNKFDIYYL